MFLQHFLIFSQKYPKTTKIYISNDKVYKLITLYVLNSKQTTQKVVNKGIMYRYLKKILMLSPSFMFVLHHTYIIEPRSTISWSTFCWSLSNRERTCQHEFLKTDLNFLRTKNCLTFVEKHM